jgi:hypothetical protein
MRVTRSTAGVTAWVLAATITVGLVAAPVSPAVVAHAAVGPRVVLAPGVTYERIKDPDGPWVLHVVRFDPTQAATIDLAAGGATMGAYSRPSDIGRARGALVAINGDFGLNSGHPLHPFAMDGSLMGRGIQNGANFAVAQDGSASFTGPDQLMLRGAHIRASNPFDIAEWNSGKPAPGEIVAFTRYGGRVEPAPGNACSAQLKPDGAMRWDKRGTGVTRRYVVDKRKCQPAALAARRRTVVLVSNRKGTGATTIKGMALGDRVRLSWSFGWTHVMDSIGGMPHIVDGGVNVAGDCASYFCDRNPRTGVGVMADGTVLLVVVDGRSANSVGMTLIQFGKAFLSLGAVEALNLDGGGSSAMWIKGSGVVSDPSDSSGERPVVNALLVLPGADTGERTMSGPLGAPAMTTVDASLAGLLAATDPGSTGGLADAWVAADLGMSSAPPSIARLARIFRLRG